MSEFGPFEISNRIHCLCLMMASFSKTVYYKVDDGLFYDRWTEEFYKNIMKMPRSKNILLHIMSSAFSYRPPKWSLMGDSKV